MRGDWIRRLMLPLLLAAGLGACASNGVQPGIVYSSGVPQGSTYGNGPYGGGPYGGGPANSGGPYGGAQRVSSAGQQGGYGNYPQQGAYPQQQTAYPQQGNNPQQGNYPQAQAAGGSGRVVSINEVAVAGAGGGGGGGNGTMMGGLLGAGAGATIGALTSHTLGGGLVGAVLGAVGGAIIGTIADGQHGGTGRGIEVTVQRDDGQQVTVAQRDDGDIQLGDRVQIVQNRQGVAQVVRDTQQQRAPD
jgi:outer membrane lipoprotein SlyB